MPYEKRYISATGDFEIWQIYDDGRERRVTNYEFRADYDPNTVIEIPYIAPPPPPEPIPPTLEELKAAKVAELKARHDEILTQGCAVTFQNTDSEVIQTKFDCEESNQSDWIRGQSFINSAIKYGAIQADGTTLVRDFYDDDHYVKVDVYDFIIFQIGGYIYQLRQTYWSYVNAANAAQSAEELAAVVW